ncbi:MAG: hypothetical protein Unbinned4098contig1000_12 [Prokaryotic dsDNA virus sp.]|nr:MAG: hypothetical protein Unbinned4098contig1000_12 [Prokaryotic dsDNA virus sp.]|tara:strand:- start:1187 stop:1669 length:483 start_codon:yes stop_codon:yes gene_type:complete
MANLEKTYDVSNAPATNETNYELMPDGDYVVIINESDMKPTKKGTGKYLQLTIEIIEGDYTGRRVWSRLNLINPSATAVDIAERDLADIQRAVGKNSVSDSTELHDIPFVVTLKTRPASNGYEASNEVASYKPLRSADGSKAETPWSEGATEDEGVKTPF